MPFYFIKHIIVRFICPILFSVWRFSFSNICFVCEKIPENCVTHGALFNDFFFSLAVWLSLSDGLVW